MSNTITQCHTCGKTFEFNEDCLYDNSRYFCKECTDLEVNDGNDLYMKCSHCNHYFCVVHVDTDRRKKLCSYCNIVVFKNYNPHYDDSTVTDRF